MTSDRPYKIRMKLDQIINEFKRYRGSQFCPDVVDVIVELLESKKIVPLKTQQQA